jgi:metal-sulfur cluster biosynthetic enzyme
VKSRVAPDHQPKGGAADQERLAERLDEIADAKIGCDVFGLTLQRPLAGEKFAVCKTIVHSPGCPVARRT